MDLSNFLFFIFEQKNVMLPASLQILLQVITVTGKQYQKWATLPKPQEYLALPSLHKVRTSMLEVVFSLVVVG